ncbi:MAG: MFS transporter [Candidatus Aramenus sp.]|jgi:MFS family permease|nr:MFS transporter [Candidatus Aramenus sp.]
MEDEFSKVDFSKWTSSHWSLFTSLAIGFFMWGVIASIAPLFYPSVNQVWFLIVPIVAQLAGDLGISALSDLKLGRKGTFFLTMVLYGAGSLLIFGASTLSVYGVIPSSSPLFLGLVTLGIILGNLGIEGEVPTALSYASETMPLRLRETMLVLLPNFDNVGAMMASLIALVTYNLTDSSLVELRFLGLFAIILVGVAIFVRYRIPESVRWLVKAKKEEKAEEELKKFSPEAREEYVRLNKRTSLATRFAFLVIISVSQYLTYGLMAYVIADYYFSGTSVDQVIFVANLGASLAGFLASALANRMASRIFALFSYLGGVSTMGLIVGYVIIPGLLAYALPTLYVMFYALLFLNMFFSEFGWAARTIYEPTLMPIRARAFFIGLIRMFPMVSYALSIQLTSGFNELQFVMYNLALWLLGAGGSLMWLFKGYDVNMVPIEQTSQEDVKKGAIT